MSNSVPLIGAGWPDDAVYEPPPLSPRAAALAKLASYAMSQRILLDYEPGHGLVTADRIMGLPSIKVNIPSVVQVIPGFEMVQENPENFQPEPVRDGRGAERWQYR